MSLTNNGFVRACLSGFGTGTTAGKALGMTILLILSGFIILYYVILWSYKLFKKFGGKSIPNFKQGPYSVRIDECHDAEALRGQLLRITGYDAKLAEKVLRGIPSIAVKGADSEMADDFKTILEAAGAKVSVVA